MQQDPILVATDDRCACKGKHRGVFARSPTLDADVHGIGVFGFDIRTKTNGFSNGYILKELGPVVAYSFIILMCVGYG